MTQLSTINNQTMSSREIAELTGKNHADVLRDIRNMLEVLKKDASIFADIYLDALGRSQPCFSLDRELTLTLVSGYDIALRHRVVTRLGELEVQAKSGFQIPTTLSAALRLAADQADTIEVQQAQLAIATPKAEALDRITLSDGSMCVTNAAKVLGAQPKKLFAWMQENQWIYRRAGGSGFVGYQTRIQSGYLDHKVTTVSRSDGSEKTVEQVLVTPKGLTKLAGAFSNQLSI